MEHIISIKDFVISMLGEFPPQYEIFIILISITIFLSIIFIVIYIIKLCFSLLGGW